MERISIEITRQQGSQTAVVEALYRPFSEQPSVTTRMRGRVKLAAGESLTEHDSKELWRVIMRQLIIWAEGDPRAKLVELQQLPF